MWPHIHDLKVGDEISVRIIEADNCDPPEKEHIFPKEPYPTTEIHRGKSVSGGKPPNSRDDEAFRLFPDDTDEKQT